MKYLSCDSFINADILKAYVYTILFRKILRQNNSKYRLTTEYTTGVRFSKRETFKVIQKPLYTCNNRNMFLLVNLLRLQAETSSGQVHTVT